MLYALTAITQPVTNPVSLALAKAHLRIDHDEENELIEGWIGAARELCETHTGKVWGERSLRMTMSGFPCGAIELPTEPVSAVTKLTYLDPSGTLVSYANEAAVTAAFQVWLESSPPLVAPLPQEIWPLTEIGRLNALTVEFTAGADEVPEMVKSAMLLVLGQWDENRGDQNKLVADGLPPAARALLDKVWTGSYLR